MVWTDTLTRCIYPSSSSLQVAHCLPVPYVFFWSFFVDLQVVSRWPGQLIICNNHCTQTPFTRVGKRDCCPPRFQMGRLCTGMGRAAMMVRSHTYRCRHSMLARPVQRGAAAFLTPRWEPDMGTDKAARSQIRATWHQPCRSMSHGKHGQFPAGAQRCGRIPHASVRARHGDWQGNTITDKSYMAPAWSQYVTRETWSFRPGCSVRIFVLKIPTWPWAAGTMAVITRDWRCHCRKVGLHCDEGA